ncbi:kinase-like domain-containing protein [Rhizophagus clarus]|uniref:Kinase-like domain-containing protein n=1 Tax=Rhizophagus clarus TaxID=94130 RepID=A0A8H3LIH4_9GLOM|nr:kinase-like domain-containing protein [Rhizophagus clarus]
MSNNAEPINNLNDWNKWIEDSISRKFIKYYEFKDFSNIQEIGFGDFAKVYRANWKNSHKRYAIKTFFMINDVTIKSIVREIQLQREVDCHECQPFLWYHRYDKLSSYFILKKNERKEYSLVLEYAENGTLRKYLKENFENLTWDDKLNLAFQLAYAVSCLHDEGIVHRDLNSNNEVSNSQSRIFGMIPYIDPKIFNRKSNKNNNKTELYSLNKKSDVYSIGVLLWEISSGQPPFCNESCDLGLAMAILQSLRETPVYNTSKDYIKVYTDCWNIEPDDRPTINQVVDELKVIMTKENIIIKDFHLYDCNKDNQISQVKDFTMIKSKKVESSMSSNSQSENGFDIIANDIINFLENNRNKIEKLEVLNYLNNQDITLQEINIILLNNQDNSLYIFLLGKFNHLGIETYINKKKAFELYQKAADLGNASGINNLGYCYQNGVGTGIDTKKAFELYQKAADLGNASGINSLGYCYNEGIGTNVNKNKAFELYRKAADLGNAFGINNLGYCYQNGIGININKKRAFELYQKAADLGNADGMNSLGFCYNEGVGTDVDKKKAFELYQRAADLENASGINNLGYCYQNGVGTDIDKKKAFELYQKATNLGNADGMSSLGFCYNEGVGTHIDRKMAFELYQKAADLGNANGIYCLGFCYQNGNGTNTNKKRAFELYQKAADLGNRTAQYNLALMYENGKDIDRNIDKAIYWCKKSAEQGDQYAQNKLEMLKKRK